jgi:hypothetical protein
MSGLQANRDHVQRASGKKNPTVQSVKVKEPKEPDCRKQSRDAKVGQALLQPCKTRTAHGLGVSATRKLQRGRRV